MSLLAVPIARAPRPETATGGCDGQPAVWECWLSPSHARRARTRWRRG